MTGGMGRRELKVPKSSASTEHCYGGAYRDYSIRIETGGSMPFCCCIFFCLENESFHEEPDLHASCGVIAAHDLHTITLHALCSANTVGGSCSVHPGLLALPPGIRCNIWWLLLRLPTVCP